MDEKQAALMQMRIKQNADDLQDFMKDLESWEKDIKEKDANLTRKKPILKESLPPVRGVRPLEEEKKKRRRKKVKEKPRESANHPKSSRIGSYDYRSWDKFDVDKACEEVDYQVESSSSSYESESSSADEEKEEEQKRQRANSEKNKGNDLFKNRCYEEAVECYSRAMEMDPSNAVFPANRAMALLKLDRFAAAESDCCLALDLNATYLKAYLRRATARTKLKSFTKARQDYEEVLKIEPGNTLALNELEKLDKEIGTAGMRYIRPVKRPAHLRSKKPLKRVAIEDIGAPSDLVSTPTLATTATTGTTAAAAAAAAATGTTAAAATRGTTAATKAATGMTTSGTGIAETTKAAIPGIRAVTTSTTKARTAATKEAAQAKSTADTGATTVATVGAATTTLTTAGAATTTVTTADTGVATVTTAPVAAATVTTAPVAAATVTTAPVAAATVTTAPVAAATVTTAGAAATTVKTAPVAGTVTTTTATALDLGLERSGVEKRKDVMITEIMPQERESATLLQPHQEPQLNNSGMEVIAPSSGIQARGTIEGKATNSSTNSSTPGSGDTKMTVLANEEQAPEEQHVPCDGLDAGLQKKVPPVPTSSFQFQTDWKQLKGNRSLLTQYFKAIPTTQYPVLLQQSLETGVLHEILTILHKNYISLGEPCVAQLTALTKVKRFSVAVMFLSKAQKESVSSLFEDLVSLLHREKDKQRLRVLAKQFNVTLV